MSGTGAEGEERHGQAADPAEERAVTQERGPVVVIIRQLRRQRRTRDLIERNEEAGNDGDADQIIEQHRAGHARRRIPDHQVAERHRQRRRIHEGMAPPPARMGGIRPIADDRIEAGIDKEHDQQRQPDLLGRHVQNLIVIEQQQIGETLVLDAIGHGAEAIEQLGPQGNRALGPGRLHREDLLLAKSSNRPLARLGEGGARAGGRVRVGAPG